MAVMECAYIAVIVVPYAHRTSIALGFVGWTTYVLVMILQKHTVMTVQDSHRHITRSSTRFWSSEKGVRILFIVLGGVIASLLYGKLQHRLLHGLGCVFSNFS